MSSPAFGRPRLGSPRRRQPSPAQPAGADPGEGVARLVRRRAEAAAALALAEQTAAEPGPETTADEGVQ